MKLFFDARYIRTGYHDGISRFSAGLGRALSEMTDVTFIVSDLKQLEKLPGGVAFIKIHPVSSPLEPLTARILNRHEPDIVFSPMQTMGSNGRKFKLILTSHDMIYFRHRLPPTDLNPIIRAGWWLYHASYGPERVTLNGADIVATVSHTSMRDFEKAKLTKRPIIVIPNAPQHLVEYVKDVDQTKSPKNLIYIGSFMPYKNVETLIKGMKWLPDHTLHLLSKITADKQAELEKIIPPKAKVVFHRGVSDQTYAELLANRGVLVTASRDEGYGLPVAEALSLGVPAVVSDISIFHEVAAGGALYFNPNKPKAFADQVKKLDSSKVRQKVITNGQNHISTFTWEGSASTLLNAINSLLTPVTIGNHGHKKEISKKAKQRRK